MKKLIVLAAVLMVCLAGCTLSGLDIKVDNATSEEVKLVEE